MSKNTSRKPPTPRARTRKRPRIDLRAKIIDSAISLLRSSGVRSLAQPQIARHAGIPQGHLTYYFPKRSDLLIAIAEHSIKLIASTVSFYSPSACAGKPLPAKDRERVLPLVQALLEDHERTRLLIGLLVESDDNPKLRRAFTESTREVQDLAAKLFGGRPEEPDAQLVFAALCGFGLMHFLQEGKGDWASGPFLKHLTKRLGKSETKE